MVDTRATGIYTYIWMDADRSNTYVLAANSFLGLEATKLGVHGIAGGVFHHPTLEVYRIDSNGLAATMTTQLTHQSYVE